ncbi:MAG: RelA/SpoT family protein [Bacteroidales bacterium]|nr:RelA/SpoT family protein [Bacteroidales bacterium]
MYQIDEEFEKKEILRRYRLLFKLFKREISQEEHDQIHKAFTLAVNAHEHTRRKSGEPYIYHPLEVAHIVVEDIGLGPTAVVCALLHDVVEDTEYTLTDIENGFGPVVARIVDGLTKIEEIFNQNQSFSIQAENFKKLLFSLSDDVRVILIKLADRLHNMRTLDSMPRDKQLKIASETINIYTPLANRLGLFSIKSELEDLALKYTEPETYSFIAEKIRQSEAEREHLINSFIAPIREKLEMECLKFSISGRVKSICSILGKMKKKGVPFEEVYDLFAIRIVLDSPVETEKADCYRVYAIINSIYRAKPDRLRDWIAIPKPNGYEALHTTVMSSNGKWIEVQIRSKRMDEIAERGYAAHWRYKNEGLNTESESGLDLWLNKIKEMLEHSGSDNSLSFLNDFRQNFFNGEIYLYTPTGEVKTLPVNSSVLDFAFLIHSEIGFTVIGAKVNHKLVPINHILKNGDQVELICSKTQKPTEKWLSYVTSSRAKSRIRQWLREEHARFYNQGQDALQRIFEQLSVPFSEANLKTVQDAFSRKNKSELFYAVAVEQIKEADIKPLFKADAEKHENWLWKWFRSSGSSSKDKPSLNLQDAIQAQVENKPESMLLGNDVQNLQYIIPECCNPIPGDDVIGIILPNKGIEVHRTNCPKAIELMSQYGNRIVKAKWKKNEKIGLLTGILISGFDRPGMALRILEKINQDSQINIRSINMKAAEGVYEGQIMLYINNTTHLQEMIDRIRQVDGVESVKRIDHK